MPHPHPHRHASLLLKREGSGNLPVGSGVGLVLEAWNRLLAGLAQVEGGARGEYSTQTTCARPGSTVGEHNQQHHGVEDMQVVLGPSSKRWAQPLSANEAPAMPFDTALGRSLPSSRLTVAIAGRLLLLGVLYHRSRRCQHLHWHYNTYTVGRTLHCGPGTSTSTIQRLPEHYEHLYKGRHRNTPTVSTLNVPR
ncbi:hypothetical protein L1887_50143 [Cichorium endivia]|nr:hypothetical protein L1887_50143 [Cichorium endivia]